MSLVTPPTTDSPRSNSFNVDAMSALRILVIDDDEFLCSEIKLRLEDIGHTVVTALSGEQGLALVESFQPQLILVDWHLPGMNGLDVCRTLRRHPLGQLFYIMVFTQYGDDDLLVEAFDAGVDDYIPKPITPRVLAARIRAGERLIKLQADVERERLEAHRYLDIVEVMMLGLDLQGNITMANRKVCQALGYDERELLGLNWFGTIIPEDYCESIRAFFDSVVNEGMTGLRYFESQIVTRSGERRLIAWRNSVIYNQDKVSGFLFAGDDITEQRSAEQEREQLSKNLQQAQKIQAMGNLTGGIAHNFNNILASVIGYSEMVQEQIAESDDKTLKLFIDNIHHAGLEAQELVESLMLFSRGGEGESSVPLLPPILNDIERMLKPVLTSSIAFTVDASENIPLVMINPEQVHQMVTNLCINARDAIGNSGSINVSLSHQPHLSGSCSSCHEAFEGEFVELAVTDNGSGVSDEIIDSMFNPFVSDKGVGQGVGLGLSMVHGTMHNYHGHILVESSDEGTVVRLLFPVLNDEPNKSN